MEADKTPIAIQGEALSCVPQDIDSLISRIGSGSRAGPSSSSNNNALPIPQSSRVKLASDGIRRVSGRRQRQQKAGIEVSLSNIQALNLGSLMDMLRSDGAVNGGQGRSPHRTLPASVQYSIDRSRRAVVRKDSPESASDGRTLNLLQPQLDMDLNKDDLMVSGPSANVGLPYSFSSLAMDIAATTRGLIDASLPASDVQQILQSDVSAGEPSDSDEEARGGADIVGQDRSTTSGQQTSSALSGRYFGPAMRGHFRQKALWVFESGSLNLPRENPEHSAALQVSAE